MVAVGEQNDGRAAETQAILRMSEAVVALAAEISASHGAMTEIKVDIAIIKERQTTAAVLREDFNRMEARLKKMETRDAEQDGAYKGLHFVKDFGPWLLSLAVLAWGFLARSPR